MKCVYATSGWGIHDRRWMEALKRIRFAPVAVSRQQRAVEDFRQDVFTQARDSQVVLAGPLDAVAYDLRELPVPIVGLSWGFDIPSMNRLGWLAGLRGVVVDSRANLRAVQAAGVDRERIVYLPWGVDLVRFAEGPKTRPLAIVPDGARMLLSLRAHEPQYRVETVVDAFALLRQSGEDTHLVIGNSGTQTDDLRRRVHSMGLQDVVHFIGVVPEPDLPMVLRAADCYISASEVDGTSVTLLQAMACGVPVAVSDIEGNREWIDDGVTGYLFSLGSPQSATSAIQRALSEPGTRVAARLRVELWADWEANLPRLTKVLGVPSPSPCERSE